MSEATVVESAIPDGWYQDPAKADMQRFWTRNAWTEHVRYAEKKRSRSLALAPLPTAVAVLEERPAISAFENRPAVAHVERTQFEIPASGKGNTAPRLDDYYVPMARFQPHPKANMQILPQRRWARAIGLWVLAVAAIGVAAGAALWVFLPR